MRLEDGDARFDSVTQTRIEGTHAWYRVVLREGRNREVRRLWQAVGSEVSRLLRIRYGPVQLPRELAAGSWQLLPPAIHAQLPVAAAKATKMGAAGSGAAATAVPQAPWRPASQPAADEPPCGRPRVPGVATSLGSGLHSRARRADPGGIFRENSNFGADQVNTLMHRLAGELPGIASRSLPAPHYIGAVPGPARLAMGRGCRDVRPRSRRLSAVAGTTARAAGGPPALASSPHR